MQRYSWILCLLAIGLLPVAARAGVVADLQAGYQQQGAGMFRAEQGERLFRQRVAASGAAEGGSCSDCHGADPSQPGKHLRTGKAIAPLSPWRDPARLQDAAKVEKWFLRNCKGTLGRECTPQEKGDFLSYLTSVR
ncbi:MAG: DUF1924 domain-containing protein [Magnetococcales bacterium]|nr:DUF1924 domain-containing protein [Magnetococcales bacterium]